MLAIAAAIAFAVAFVINATETSTDIVFAPASLQLVGLVLVALHLAGLGSGWSVPSRRGRRR